MKQFLYFLLALLVQTKDYFVENYWIIYLYFRATWYVIALLLLYASAFFVLIFQIAVFDITGRYFLPGMILSVVCTSCIPIGIPYVIRSTIRDLEKERKNIAKWK